VILDGVFNHASRGFWPFNHVLECGLGSPYVDWFHVDREALAAGRSLRAYPDESMRHASEHAEVVDHFGSGHVTWATRPGGTCPRCRSSTPTTRRSAST
jgi:glycosidase